MKNKIIAGLGVLLLAMIVWWFKPIDTSAEKQKHPNVVSMQVGETVIKTDELKRQETQSTTESIITFDSNNVDVQKKDETPNSYLKIYRQLKLAEACARIYDLGLDKREDDYEAWLIKRMQQHRDDATYMPPTKQFEQLHEMVKGCLGLMELVIGFQQVEDKFKYKQLLRKITTELVKQLGMTPPETEKETAIANVLADISAWENSLADLLHASQGEDTLSQDEIQKLKDEIGQLRLEMQRSLGTNNNDDAPTWLEFNDAIEKKELILNNQKQVDVTLRSQLLAAFNEESNKLFHQLGTKDPDVFLELNTALEFSHKPFTSSFSGNKHFNGSSVTDSVPEYISPTEVMMAQLGLKGKNWLHTNGDHVNRLYYCHLGGQCGPDDLLTATQCLPLSWYPNTNACGVAVVTFMQSNLLTPNQWDDVQMVLEWMKVNYGS